VDFGGLTLRSLWPHAPRSHFPQPGTTGRKASQVESPYPSAKVGGGSLRGRWTDFADPPPENRSRTPDREPFPAGTKEREGGSFSRRPHGLAPRLLCFATLDGAPNGRPYGAVRRELLNAADPIRSYLSRKVESVRGFQGPVE